MTSYKFLILIGLLAIMIMDTTSNYASELQTCREGINKDDQKCEMGPYCFTFNGTKEDIDAKESVCNIKLGETGVNCRLPIVSVKKKDKDFFTVVLMGKMKKSGWFAIGFSDDANKIMKKNNFAVACFTGKDPEVLNLGDNSAASSVINPPTKAKKQSIKNVKYSYKSDHLVCQFDLPNKPKNDGPQLDLIGKGYFIGLARGESDGKTISQHDVNNRGSSLNRMDFFKYLEVYSTKYEQEKSHGSHITITTNNMVGIVGTILSTFGAIYLV